MDITSINVKALIKNVMTKSQKGNDRNNTTALRQHTIYFYVVTVNGKALYQKCNDKNQRDDDRKDKDITSFM